MDQMWHNCLHSSCHAPCQVEGYFVDTLATLFPYYHISYWMGLTSNDGLYPRFTWLDYNTLAPGGQACISRCGRALLLAAGGTTVAAACTFCVSLPPLQPPQLAYAAAAHAAGNGRYQAWGISPAGAKNPRKRQFCGVGNFSETVQSVWGWADEDCTVPHIFICEVKRGRHACLQGSCVRGIAAGNSCVVAGCSHASMLCAVAGPFAFLHSFDACSWICTCPLVCCAAYTGPDNYTNAQGVRWTFNNLATNQSAAEALCNMQCGHLASYTSAQEQNDVEGFYIDNVGGQHTGACSLCPDDTVVMMQCRYSVLLFLPLTP